MCPLWENKIGENESDIYIIITLSLSYCKGWWRGHENNSQSADRSEKVCRFHWLTCCGWSHWSSHWTHSPVSCCSNSSLVDWLLAHIQESVPSIHWSTSQSQIVLWQSLCELHSHSMQRATSRYFGPKHNILFSWTRLGCSLKTHTNTHLSLLNFLHSHIAFKTTHSSLVLWKESV